MSVSNDNVRIVRNTLIVYVRLIVTAVIGLITSRYVIQILGASDYGLYSVIGGVIAMFTFISGSLQSTTIRYINYEMGKPDGNLKKVFNTSRQIHILFAFIILFAAEALGLYYINNYLNVASSRIDDALFVFHISIVVACLGIINVPYQGLLVANEKFSHIAIIDIIGACLKLLLVLGLFLFDGNALRFYAAGMSCITLLQFIVYRVVCYRNWSKVIGYQLVKNVIQQKEMLVFNNYTLLATASLISRNQGSTLLVNYFFGTILNAAYAISNTVYTYVNMFAGCFDQASAPQITQNLSRGNNERALFLVNYTCRICILLVEIIYFMLVADIDLVLYIWLGDGIPDGTASFCKLILFLAIVSATSGGLAQYINGLGYIKWFTIRISILYMMALLICIIFYKIGLPAESVIVLFITADVLNRASQLQLLRKMVNFPVATFLKQAYLRPAIVFVMGYVLVGLYQSLELTSLLFRTFGVLILGLLMIVIVTFVGLFYNERVELILTIKNRINGYF